MFGAMLIIGGGGSLFALPAMLTQCLALVFITWAVLVGADRLLLSDGRWLLAAAALVVAVPLLQLVPLPPAMFAGVPGHATANAVLAAIDAQDAWRPITLDPDATRRAVLSLLPAIAVLVATLVATAQQRRRLVLVVVAIAVVGAFMGALQVSDGVDGRFMPHAGSHAGAAVGIFSNRNHHATLMIVAIVLATVSVATSREVLRSPRSRTLMAGAAMAMFAAAVVSSTSRAGFVLLPLGLLCGAGIAWHGLLGRRLLPLLFVVPIAGAGLAALALFNTPVIRLLGRFSARDVRAEFWADTWYAIRTFWPHGSGVGTFDPVYRSVEQLDHVIPAYVNHAHNDYLELALETGVLGLIVAIVVAAIVLRAWLRTLRTGDHDARQFAMAGAAVLAIVMLHSMVDYPLRTVTLQAVCALAVGLCTIPATAFVPERARSGEPERQREPSSRSPMPGEQIGGARPELASTFDANVVSLAERRGDAWHRARAPAEVDGQSTPGMA